MVAITAFAAAACFFVLAVVLASGGRWLPGGRAMRDAAVAQAVVGCGLMLRAWKPHSLYGPVLALATVTYGAHGVWMLAALRRLTGRTSGLLPFGLPTLALVALAAGWGLWDPPHAYDALAFAYLLMALTYAGCVPIGLRGGRPRAPLAIVALCGAACCTMYVVWSAVMTFAPDEMAQRGSGPWLIASLLFAVWLNLVATSAYLTVVVGRLLQEIAAQALQDPLTGCLNRRGLERGVSALLAEDARAGRPSTMAVLVVDLDHFKRVNDRHGHAAGDAVLVAVARRLQQGLRSRDLLARMGGEEFLVVLHGLDAVAAQAVAERLRHDLASLPVPPAGGLPVAVPVTTSIGVAAGPVATPDLAPLVARADTALYEAKRAGRDRVAVAGDPPARPPAAVATA